MSSTTPSPSDLTPATPRRTLTDRVKARVTEAGLALDHRNGKPNPKSKSLRPARVKRPTKGILEGPQAERDAQSLRRVYSELRTTYHRYRQETGRPAVPELRDAVHAFRRGPSLTSLVSVASFLDDRGLLGW